VLVVFFSVIGKGGEQIASIQSETECRIQFAPGLSLLFCAFLISVSHASSFSLGCSHVVQEDVRTYPATIPPITILVDNFWSMRKVM